MWQPCGFMQFYIKTRQNVVTMRLDNVI